MVFCCWKNTSFWNRGMKAGQGAIDTFSTPVLYYIEKISKSLFKESGNWDKPGVSCHHITIHYTHCDSGQTKCKVLAMQTLCFMPSCCDSG